MCDIDSNPTGFGIIFRCDNIPARRLSIHHSKTKSDTNLKCIGYFNRIVESIVLNFGNSKLFFCKVMLKTVSGGRLFRKISEKIIHQTRFLS